MGFKTYITMFKSSVEPMLLYATEVWGTRSFDACDHSVQNRARRFLMGVNRFCPIVGLQGEVGLDTIENRSYLSVIRNVE